MRPLHFNYTVCNHIFITFSTYRLMFVFISSWLCSFLLALLQLIIYNEQGSNTLGSLLRGNSGSADVFALSFSF